MCCCDSSSAGGGRLEEVHHRAEGKWMTRKMAKSNTLLCGWGTFYHSDRQCLAACVCVCVCDWCAVLCCMSRWMMGLLVFPLAEHKSLLYPPSLNLYRVKCLCSQLLHVTACVFARRHTHTQISCLKDLSPFQCKSALAVVTGIDSSISWAGRWGGGGYLLKRGGATWTAHQTFLSFLFFCQMCTEKILADDLKVINCLMFGGICSSWAAADKNSEKDFRSHLWEPFSRFLVN